MDNYDDLLKEQIRQLSKLSIETDDIFALVKASQEMAGTFRELRASDRAPQRQLLEMQLRLLTKASEKNNDLDTCLLCTHAIALLCRELREDARRQELIKDASEFTIESSG